MVTPRRLRVLVLDEALPWPPDSGKRIRTLALLERLAPHVDIRLCVHAEGPLVPADVRAVERTGIEVVAVPRRPLVKRGWRFGWDLLRNAVLPAPYMVMAHRTRAMRRAVEREVNARRPDLIHVEWTPYVVNVPPGMGLPVVVSAHNVESDIWARYRATERSVARRTYIALQHVKVRRFEREALASARAVTAVSESDAASIREWSGQRDVTVVPNGVDAQAFAPRPDVVPDGSSVLFTGSLDWRPNQDAVLWYLAEVHPRVRARRPDARFVVVGRRPPDGLAAVLARQPGVELHGSVPDVRPFVAEAGVNVVPLRIGGGSRLKIPEALAMGRPVVSTTVGAEGLDLGDGLVRADTPEALAEAVLDALAHPAQAAARAERGRERVLARYEWNAIAPLQRAVWERVGAAFAGGRA